MRYFVAGLPPRPLLNCRDNIRAVCSFITFILCFYFLSLHWFILWRLIAEFRQVSQTIQYSVFSPLNGYKEIRVIIKLLARQPRSPSCWHLIVICIKLELVQLSCFWILKILVELQRFGGSFDLLSKRNRCKCVIERVKSTSILLHPIILIYDR